MTTRVKSALLLGVTLLIGVVLGAVVNAWIADRRFERVGYFRSERGFTRHLEEAIGTIDEAQRDEVRAILERSATRMRQHMEASQAEGRRIIDSTHDELAKVLTPEQLARLESQLRHERGPGGRGGPGPGGRGPGRRGGPPPGHP